MFEILQQIATDYKDAIELVCLLMIYGLLMGLLIEGGKRK